MERRSAGCRTSCTRRMLRRRCGRWARDRDKDIDRDKSGGQETDMEFVQNFTPTDFQAKNFTPSISPNLNGFSKKQAQKLVQVDALDLSL